MAFSNDHASLDVEHVHLVRYDWQPESSPNPALQHCGMLTSVYYL